MRMWDEAGGEVVAAEITVQRFAIEYAFPVAFTRDAFDPSNPVLRDCIAQREPNRRHRCLVYLDANLVAARPSLPAEVEAYFAAHDDALALAGGPILAPGGEAIKDGLAFIEAQQRLLHRLGIDRHSYVVAVGGGAVLDAVGFAAAIAHRGIRHVRLPSTVLGQNDSGVGVKNAVNLDGIKNFIGSFAPPWAVVNDFALLETLPARERIAGLAEAVKVALIRDAAFFERLERDAAALAAFEPETTAHMIRRCAELHMRQIAHGGDPFERGSVRPLDYGHWSAHKLEALTRNMVRHGEAVAIGMALDARYAVLAGLLAAGAEERIARLLERLGFVLWRPELAMRTPEGELAVLAGLREFQEHLGGELTITLLRAIGVGEEVHAMDVGLIAEALGWLEARAAAGRAR